MRIIKEHPYCFVYGLLVLFYFVFAAIVPLAQDDWGWYIHGYNQWFNEHFKNLNGRYFGNILEILAVRSLLLRMVVYALVSFSILWIVLKFADKTKSTAYILIAFIMLLLMPASIFKQTYAWYAGFNNYVTSALCALVVLLFVLKTLHNQERKTQWSQRIELVCFYIACIAGQLFMENVTLYNIAITGLGLLVYLVIYRKINLKLLIGFCLTWIGAIIMFTNPNYMNILAGNSSYQQVGSSTSMYDKVIQTLLKIIPYYGYFQCAIFLSVLAVVLLIILYRSSKFLSLSLVYKVMITVALAFFTVYKYFVYEPFDLDAMKHIPWVAGLNFLACLIYFCAVAVGLYFIGLSKKSLLTTYFSLASIVIATMPLLVVAPVGPRNFYFMYVLWLVILLIVLKQLPLPERRTSLIAGSIALVAVIVFMSAFSFMSYANTQRIAKIKEEAAHASKDDVIIVEMLPFDVYTQHSSPWSVRTQRVFKQYFGIPQEARLKFVPYGQKYLQPKVQKKNK